MGFSALLIANRGEIAIRIARAAADLGLKSVAIYSEDDANSLHTRVADEAVALEGLGARAYLDLAAVVAAAKSAGCDAVHPGYGFLSEQAEFARRCSEEGITFVGPKVEHLTLFGDKAQARSAAVAAEVPVNRGIDRAVTVDEAREFYESLGEGSAIIIKALAGGGGRGTSGVTDINELPAIFERCQREAKGAFGIEDVYVEEFVQRARHVEVQIVGDLVGNVAHLGERECSVQRMNQKVVEIAPAPGLDDVLRQQIVDAAVRFAEKEGYASLGTFEFLVDETGREGAQPFVFIEANARLQVEHTVTEEVTGVDLVQSQIRIAEGMSLGDLGLDDPSVAIPRGYAIQARVNMEKFNKKGQIRPASGTFTAYEPPSGPGVRTDGFGYVGYATSTGFDSLLAKVIVHTRTNDFVQAASRTVRALSEFRIDGVGNNISFLQNILSHDDFANSQVHTRWVDEHIMGLIVDSEERARFVSSALDATEFGTDGFAGARVDTNDPLALFAHDQQVKSARSVADQTEDPVQVTGPDGSVGMSSPIQGTIVSIDVEVGAEVVEGQQVAVVEAMKMEHVINADLSGAVREVTMSTGDIVREGFPIVFIEEAEVSGHSGPQVETIDPDYIRPDLEENIERHSYIYDENRPEAVEKRHARGYRMPRVNIGELMDDGSFKEYWPLLVARQHRRHDMQTLREQTPTDGVVAGTGTINGDLFGEDDARAMVVHYDYTVLAGTQGGRNHYKQDRMFELAHRFRMPLVLFGEGGGGRPGDDATGPGVAFDTHTFTRFSQLSGLVPLVCVINGRTFAGNTALVACCDVIIATEKTTVAMGGPAMIEGGGLGIYTPEEVGPMSFQVPRQR